MTLKPGFKRNATLTLFSVFFVLTQPFRPAGFDACLPGDADRCGYGIIDLDCSDVNRAGIVRRDSQEPTGKIPTGPLQRSVIVSTDQIKIEAKFALAPFFENPGGIQHQGFLSDVPIRATIVRSEDRFGAEFLLPAYRDGCPALTTVFTKRGLSQTLIL